MENTLRGVAINPQLRWKRNKFEYTDSFGNECILESRHELKVAQELDNNNIKWIRPKSMLISDGRRYEPDFYLVDYNVYLDPKSKWKFQENDPINNRFVKAQEKQLEKIQMCEKEHGVKIYILYASDKRSFS